MASIIGIAVKQRKPLDSLLRYASTSQASEYIDEEFRVFDVRNRKSRFQKKTEKYVKPKPLPPREKRMQVDQDWTNVWPGTRTFHPASVPLPLRQGHASTKTDAPTGKYANAELMKIPNFLHLTPPAIKKHCEALKKFCTPWPKGIETEELIEQHFPIEVTTTDYCHSSPKIRDPKARVVTFKFKLRNLYFDEHAKDKALRLLGERYNPDTDEITLVADRCPLRKQNYDYNWYLITAVFHESWQVEPWEAEKGEDDMEYYNWDKNRSRKEYIALQKWPVRKNEIDYDSVSLEHDEVANAYKEAVTDIFMKGESTNNLFKYKEIVLKMVL